MRACEGVLGYRFRRPELCLEALTHVSWPRPGVPCYQRLELLGDALLGLSATLALLGGTQQGGGSGVALRYAAGHSWAAHSIEAGWVACCPGTTHASALFVITYYPPPQIEHLHSPALAT